MEEWYCSFSDHLVCLPCVLIVPDANVNKWRTVASLPPTLFQVVSRSEARDSPYHYGFVEDCCLDKLIRVGEASYIRHERRCANENNVDHETKRHDDSRARSVNSREVVHLAHITVESNVNELRSRRRFLICENRIDFLGNRFDLVSDGERSYLSLRETNAAIVSFLYDRESSRYKRIDRA